MHEALQIYKLVGFVTFVADAVGFSLFVAKRANQSKVLATGAAILVIALAVLLAKEGAGMVLLLAAAGAAGYVAISNGRSTFPWSIGTLLLGPAVLLVLLCLPDLSVRSRFPRRAEGFPDGPFLLPIDDTFAMPHREMMVAGRVERGKIKVGQEVEIVGWRRESLQRKVKNLEMSKQIVREAWGGDRIGVLLAETDKVDVGRGMVLSQPGSVTAHAKLRAETMALTKERGGREAGISHGLQAHFHFWSADVAGTLKVLQETQTVSPGEAATLEIELASPVAMEKGLRFTILENDQTVGMGTVTELL